MNPKNPLKWMLIVVIILLLASIGINAYQAHKAKKCTCTDDQAGEAEGTEQ